MLRFFLLPSGGPVIFFFESHVDQTVDRLGTRVEFTELRAFRRNLRGADNETWSRWRFSKT